ncbi:hypothetical protein [Streptomyces beijiangensis]|uniref:Lipoprotein n=1 Tax=Streptomyces beijiangensis TaxID=163361 RepID=A0A939JIL5_9ACTN|nr:hypothetical protein [Streptomyces beijiangensis]MBO0515643.1 hypothetical protein [Streptomyces beijiangensis]
MRSRVLLASAVTIMACALAGCGSGDDTAKVPTADRGGSAGTSATPRSNGGGDDVSAYISAQRVWVKCLRTNGLDAPDPDAKGQVEFGDAATLKKNPKFLDAQDKCKSLKAAVPESVEQGNQPKLSAAQIKVKRKYADCMQKNGAADFPDPGPDGYGGNDAQWDQASAGAKRAARLCGPIVGIPGDAPSAQG